MDRDLDRRMGVIRMEDKQNTSHWVILLVDAVGMIAAYMIAYYLRFYNPLFSVEQLPFAPLAEYMKLLIYLVPVYLLIYDRLQVNTLKFKKYSYREMLRFILTNVICIICFFVILYIMKEYNISRIFLLIFFVINVVFGISIRMLYFHFYEKNGDGKRLDRKK